MIIKGYDMHKQDFLSKSQTDAMRGISIIIIILYHLTISGINNTWIFPFAYGRFVGVAIFFLLSGYALFEQYKINGIKYLNGFLLRKIPRLYVSFIILYLLFFIYDIFFLQCKDLVPTTILNSIFTFSFGGDRLWYLCAQTIFYIFFYIIFLIERLSDLQKIISILICIFFYTVCCIFIGFDITWYFNAAWFPLGMLVSKNKDLIFSLLYRFRLVILIGTFLVMLCLFAFLYFFGYVINGYDLYYIVQIIIILNFIPFLIIFFQYIKINILSLIGKYSMELYITHNSILMCIFDWKINSVFQICFLIIFSIVLSIIIKFVVNKICYTKLFKVGIINDKDN